jgi:hypothetical protein
MSSEQERCDWLHEHLNYELLMVRHTHKQLQARIKTVNDQLVWNANFGAFALYARNIYLFLTNDRDSRNFKASDYERPEANGKPLEGVMNNLQEQVFHPGKQRVNANKVGLEKAKKVFDWVEDNMKTFLSELKEPYAAAWNPDWAEPSKLTDITTFDVSNIKQDSASSHPGMLLTTTSFSGD